MSNPSKNKGKNWERDFAKHISKVAGKNFQRVPNSGAFVGGKNLIRVNTLTPEQIGMFEGDIITPEEWNHVRFECKFYKKLAWNQVLHLEGESQLNSWVKQAEQGTRSYWFLCFKINNIGKFVVFPAQLKDVYDFDGHIHYQCKSLKNTYRIVTMDGFFERNKDRIEGLRK